MIKNLKIKINFQNPIKNLFPPHEWEHVYINESGEQLVSLKDMNSRKIIVSPYYFETGVKGAINDCFLRKTVADLLINASSLLPDNIGFIVYDAWRPVNVQMEIFNDFSEVLKSRYPNLIKSEIDILTKQYVSLPSTSKTCPSPHSTGGAVDLTLVNLQNGLALEMGTSFDSFEETAHTRYYEKQVESGIILSELDQLSLVNRRMLFHVMTSVGFSNYAFEWWHYDYGNQFWGAMKSKSAIYSVVTI